MVRLRLGTKNDEAGDFAPASTSKRCVYDLRAVLRAEYLGHELVGAATELLSAMTVLRQLLYLSEFVHLWCFVGLLHTTSFHPGFSHWHPYGSIVDAGGPIFNPPIPHPGMDLG